MAIHIKDKAAFDTWLVFAGDKLVIVEFFATWCGPCTMIPVDEMAAESSDTIVVLKVDVDECQELANEYGIISMPTFFFIKNTEKVEVLIGGNMEKLKATALELQ